ncbi:A/G-specific adenine glycosylase [Xenophilus arseniciresistens]|uniref:Adenine DNA glycosylase n=1 Tax=Xenophilus arseniciresistens TaxID=1283306 RepID=A0AAE3N7X5_9BURK|nr:A/G-specific adenine glycosylase [Xenophilus arseniciresistens]MDA7415542.1 A/G-specific adenine glycosylase [Xenophilus arseniciresistens]
MHTHAAALAPAFAPALIAWQRSHGRSTLPWQNTRDPYRVWLSEIMLQQTQVVTVLGYYARFLERFPAVSALAAASEDEVLGLWSGLGYYSRARNLHRCAQDVVARFGGRFPASAQELQTLPGIGRSTAAAIAAFCFGERVAILDGNVKRVLTRVLAYEADLSRSANEKTLWDAAQQMLPAPAAGEASGADDTMARYTQGQMDLGATVCLPRQPQCLICPVQRLCRGSAAGNPERYPVRERRLRRSAQSLWLLLARRDDGAVWLHKRPAKGIWAGLHSLPVFDSEEALQAALPPQAWAAAVMQPAFVHVLTHKDLHLHPVRVAARADLQGLPPLDGSGRWVSAQEWPGLGLPAPVRRLLEDEH